MAAPAQRTSQQFAFAATFLRVAAAAAMVAAVLAAAGRFLGGNAAYADLALLAACAFAAVSAGALLYGLAVVIELLRMHAAHCEREEESRRTAVPDLSAELAAGAGLDDTTRTDQPADRAWPSGGGGGGDPAEAREMLALLRDVRDNLLLDEAQRREKNARLADDDIARAKAAFVRSLEANQFVQARRVIEELSRRFPERSEIAEWSAQVETARAKAESQDVTSYTKRVDELISISAWDRAASVAQELVDRHPGVESGRTLVARVARERELFFTEQRRRMYAEIQRYAGRRRWREAFAAAQTFIERFPDSEDSETLRVQIPTLEVNAEIEERQELESQITDLAKHARYIEAYNLALHVIQRYPGSPQAEVLRDKLTRLKELAHNPHAPPARVRVDAPA